MAATVNHLGKTLDCGDWRSKAVGSHIDESHVGASEVPPTALEASGDEDRAMPIRSL